MRYVTFFIFFLLFSQSVFAKQAVTIANDIFKVYQLHGEENEKPPIPALFIYDSQTQQIISPQQVLDIFLRDENITASAMKGITVFAKKTSSKTISQAELKKASKLININSRYVAFFHNIGQGMAANFSEFPELLAAEDAIIKHLNDQSDVTLYTFM